MAHVEPAHLVELALGNTTSTDDADALRHIAVCVRCRKELARMRRVVTTARSVDASDLPTAPPERMWERIARELSTTAEPTTPPPGPPGRGAGPLPTPRALGLALGAVAAVTAVRWFRRGRPASVRCRRRR